MLGLLLAACGGDTLTLTATPRPLLPTPTPRSTPLPAVATQVPFGTAERPYRVALILPKDSSETGAKLATALKNKTGREFEVQTRQTNAELLADLCGDVPTLAWVDGWALVLARLQGCGQAVLRYQRDEGFGPRTGLSIEFIANADAPVPTLVALRNRDFCRISDQDVQTWILPVTMLRRVPNFDPFTALRNVKDYPDIPSMLRAVSENVCAAALQVGTLPAYRNQVEGVTDITRTVRAIPNSASPELPFGGLVVSSRLPPEIGSAALELFLGSGVTAPLPDSLSGLVVADELVKAQPSDFVEIEKLVEEAGMDPRKMGH